MKKRKTKKFIKIDKKMFKEINFKVILPTCPFCRRQY